MKAYHFSAIFILGAKFHNAHGCRVADSEQGIKTWLFSQPDIIARSCVGYALTHFSCGLIDPEIAPMNREDA
jgi:fatty-acid desaturase